MIQTPTPSYISSNLQVLILYIKIIDCNQSLSDYFPSQENSTNIPFVSFDIIKTREQFYLERIKYAHGPPDHSTTRQSPKDG